MALPEELVREFQEPEEKVREAIFLALSLFPGLRVLGSGWPIRVGAPGSRGVTISAIGMDPFHTRVVISSGLESTLMKGIEVALDASSSDSPFPRQALIEELREKLLPSRREVIRELIATMVFLIVVLPGLFILIQLRGHPLFILTIQQMALSSAAGILFGFFLSFVIGHHWKGPISRFFFNDWLQTVSNILLLLLLIVGELLNDTPVGTPIGIFFFFLSCAWLMFLPFLKLQLLKRRQGRAGIRSAR